MDGKQITYPTFFFLSIVSISFFTSTINTLTVPLTHRNQQPKSISQTSTLHRLASDTLRVNALHSASAPMSSGVRQGNGVIDYVASLSIGTPPKQVHLALDTTADVVWLQCLPCSKPCNKQWDPIFDPRRSSSFSPLPCGDPRCQHLGYSYSSNCEHNKKNPCLFNQSFDPDEFTFGEFSTEKFTFENTAVVDKVAFGCGHDNEVSFEGASGFLALGPGPLSFPSQTAAQFGKKFSYCLSSLVSESPSNSSSIVFGDTAVPKKANITRLLYNKFSQAYYLDLIGISVDGKRVLGINSSTFEIKGYGQGGVYMDVLVAYNWLATPVHLALTTAFRRAFKSKHMANPPFDGFDTCYYLPNIKSVRVPSVELNFEGADVDLPVDNYFMKFTKNGTYCLTFVPNRNVHNFSVIGNILQQGFRVSFDLAKNQIGFTANACT